MYRIVEKKILNSSIVLMKVEAPRIAKSAKPGQFLIVRTGERGERIPLTVCNYDAESGTVTIVVQVVGASSRKIYHLNEGDSFTDVAGPLGRPSEFMNMERERLKNMHFLFIAGGVGGCTGLSPGQISSCGRCKGRYNTRSQEWGDAYSGGKP